MAAAKKKSSGATDHSLEWPFGMKNYILMGIALVVIILGYISLAQGSITLSPILLVLGYALVPFAIMAKGKPEHGEEQPDEPGATEE